MTCNSVFEQYNYTFTLTDYTLVFIYRILQSVNSFLMVNIYLLRSTLSAVATLALCQDASMYVIFSVYMTIGLSLDFKSISVNNFTRSDRLPLNIFLFFIILSPLLVLHRTLVKCNNTMIFLTIRVIIY